MEDSSDWYEEQAIGLGKRFVEMIKKTLVLTETNPEAFPKTKQHFREVVVEDFPYLIVYRYDKGESIVNVLHVFHTSRNPKLKYRQQ